MTEKNLSHDHRSGPPGPKNQTKDRFFSERHPGAYLAFHGLIPRLHTLILLMVIAWYTVEELMAGNYDFIYDWYRASWILPSMIEILSSQAAFQMWFEQYGPVFMILLTLTIMSSIVFHRFGWRAMFPDYYMESEGVESFEGRCYWHSGNSLYQLWDRLYKSPPRTTTSVWVRPHWWPPLNIFNPPASMERIDLGQNEALYRKGLYKIRSQERPYRRRLDIDRYHTHGDRYTTGEIPLDSARSLFTSRGEELVQDTRSLSLANPQIRLRQLRDGSYLIPEKVKEVAQNAKERGE